MGFFSEYSTQIDINTVKIAWTTTETLTQAKRLSVLAIEKQLAVCAQISGPITSIYRWNGKTEEATEFRITIKCLKTNFDALQNLILENHPYEIPQWVATDLTEVSTSYRTWAGA